LHVQLLGIRNQLYAQATAKPHLKLTDFHNLKSISRTLDWSSKTVYLVMFFFCYNLSLRYTSITWDIQRWEDD